MNLKPHELTGHDTHANLIYECGNYGADYNKISQYSERHRKYAVGFYGVKL